MKMKNFSLNIVVCTLVVAGSVLAVPEPNFVATGPGLHVPFDADETISVDDPYGQVMSVAGFGFDGWSGAPIVVSSWARYRTTLENDSSTVTPMSVVKDWVVQFYYGLASDTTGTEDSVVKVMVDGDGPNEKRVIMLYRDPNNHVHLAKGDATGASWITITDSIDMTPATPPHSWAWFTIHFKADGLGGGKIDAYMLPWSDPEDPNQTVKIAEDVVIEHGNYAIDYIQLSPHGIANKDFFRDIIIAQVSPYCGDLDHLFPTGDMNKDCRINWKDMALFAEAWLDCTAPECD